MRLSQSSKSIFEDPLFWQSHLLFIGILLCWFIPLTHPYCEAIDHFIFRLLNGTLSDNTLWQQIWGILNHRREVKGNLMMGALLNGWAILATKDPQLKAIRIKQILYFWTCFQLGFMLQEYFFNTLLHIERDSPSLILQPVAKLSLILQNSDIKDASYHSFPSGHAFSLIYWGSFTLLCAPKKIGHLSLFLAIILSSARLFSGAHWFSDVLFSAMLALVWLSWTIHTPIYHALTKEAYLLPNT